MALPHGGQGLAARRVVGENFPRRTLLDAKQYTREELAELYHKRWLAELDIRAIKCSMGMDVLRWRFHHANAVKFLNCADRQQGGNKKIRFCPKCREELLCWCREKLEEHGAG